jgi:uncharacterized metal-binding protein YceD (DUF177 family)
MGQNMFFSLPFSGIKNGNHTYRFEVNSDFFKFMKSETLLDGKWSVTLELDRRSNICDLVFNIEGHMPTTCDRCTADIILPVSSQYSLVLKVTHEDVEDTEDIIYIKNTEHTLILDQIIYELISLSVPWIRVYDCEKDLPRPCNMIVLNKLAENQNDNSGILWEKLKNINPN